MFEKVVYTLLENALRHGKTITEIEFSCRTLADRLLIIYQDNGEGIPAEFKEAIFERKFFNIPVLVYFFRVLSWASPE